MLRRVIFLLAIVSLCTWAVPPPAEGARNTLDSSLFERLEFRNIGPASMGGRITDVEGIPGNPVGRASLGTNQIVARAILRRSPRLSRSSGSPLQRNRWRYG